MALSVPGKTTTSTTAPDPPEVIMTDGSGSSSLPSQQVNGNDIRTVSNVVGGTAVSASTSPTRNSSTTGPTTAGPTSSVGTTTATTSTTTETMSDVSNITQQHTAAVPPSSKNFEERLQLKPYSFESTRPIENKQTVPADVLQLWIDVGIGIDKNQTGRFFFCICQSFVLVLFSFHYVIPVTKLCEFFLYHFPLLCSLVVFHIKSILKTLS
jgi:hypothetical protein